jgi:translation initiation factor IF-3
VRLRPNIGRHDLDFKVRNVERLLMDGAKVRVAVRFRRGREMEHTERGYQLLDLVKELLQGIAVVERPPTLEGQFLSMILGPDKRGIAQRQQQKEAGKSLV